MQSEGPRAAAAAAHLAAAPRIVTPPRPFSSLALAADPLERLAGPHGPSGGVWRTRRCEGTTVTPTSGPDSALQDGNVQRGLDCRYRATSIVTAASTKLPSLVFLEAQTSESGTGLFTKPAALRQLEVEASRGKERRLLPKWQLRASRRPPAASGAERCVSMGLSTGSLST